MKALVVSIHDVAPSTINEAREWRARVAELVAGPVSLLLVPRYRGRDSWRSGPARGWARERAADGDEIVLHGWSHVRADGRDGGVISEGLDELRLAGLAPEGYIAPAYGRPSGAGDPGLAWWATRGALAWDGGRRRLPSLGLGASTAPRRALSPAAARTAAQALAHARAVRLDLHPADLRHPRLAAAGRDLLERLLSQGRRPLTHAALARTGR